MYVIQDRSYNFAILGKTGLILRCFLKIRKAKPDQISVIVIVSMSSQPSISFLYYHDIDRRYICRS